MNQRQINWERVTTWAVIALFVGTFWTLVVRAVL